MPAYQVKVTLENDAVMLLGLTAQNPRKMMLKLVWLNNLLVGLPVVSTETQQLPGKDKRKRSR